MVVGLPPWYPLIKTGHYVMGMYQIINDTAAKNFII